MICRGVKKRFVQNLQTECTQPKALSGKLSAKQAGFTLVELLVTIAIIGILTSAVALASWQASVSARKSATRAKISTLHGLLMERYDSYANRRVRLRKNQTFGKTGLRIAQTRVHAGREIMRLEMPDRWSDITLYNIPDPTGNTQLSTLQSKTAGSPTYSTSRPAISIAYLSIYKKLLKQSNVTTEQLIDNEGAECLYMIITLGAARGEGATLFHAKDIGDVDNDGAPEFIDSWGRPIEYIRWPAGFQSELQANTQLSTAEKKSIAATDHDPFDPFNRYPEAFRLLPLIYSSGPEASELSYFTNSNGKIMPGDPYARFDDGTGTLFSLGQMINEESAVDNIHNHLKDAN